MSVKIGCMICGEQSPETIETGPAIEWSNAHRCTTEKLIAMANERRTVTRLGKMLARETDRDLVIMRELAKRLTELSNPAQRAAAQLCEDGSRPERGDIHSVPGSVIKESRGEPSDAQRHAQARLQARIHEEHAPHYHLGQCKCGAKLGDSIDWNWHLTGVALRAARGVQ